MNKNVFFVMVLLAVVILSIVGCAKDAEESSETVEEETAEESAHEYSPAVVDNLTQDFEEIGW